MVLDYTKVKIKVAYPDLSNPIASTITRTINPDAIEVANIADYDLSGDAYYVGRASFDFSGATIRYTLLSSIKFGNAPDDGFNGYVLTFAKLTDTTNRTSIRGVDIVSGLSTFAVPAENIRFDRDSIFINVDNLYGRSNEDLVLRIGFTITGTAKANWLEGDDGRDKLAGLGGNDDLFGRAGNDAMSGGDGADQLDGGRGADTLTGGAGRDTFVLHSHSGNDTVTDFQNGIDRILIRTSDNRFADLTIIEVEAGVRIRSDGATILLRGADLSDINAADFIF